MTDSVFVLYVVCIGLQIESIRLLISKLKDSHSKSSMNSRHKSETIVSSEIEMKLAKGVNKEIIYCDNCHIADKVKILILWL